MGQSELPKILAAVLAAGAVASLLGCERAEDEASPAASSSQAASGAAAAQQGAAGRRLPTDRERPHLYACTTDAPAPSADCRSYKEPEDAPGMAVVHMCATEAATPPRECTYINNQMVGAGPVCPGPGCPTSDTKP